ncbi:hypothetical protein BBP00_00008325 [Phytophthora kernoviae]|uniref:Uncharacterized protein n=1 Tax=Phytophthora kernoviae TaxID=325452 RepID=A0A3F2RFN0_9STRA|nr:hypothetical protein BBP00_00008325 [Phytophthora kernoviae]
MQLDLAEINQHNPKTQQDSTQVMPRLNPYAPRLSPVTAAPQDWSQASLSIDFLANIEQIRIADTHSSVRDGATLYVVELYSPCQSTSNIPTVRNNGGRGENTVQMTTLAARVSTTTTTNSSSSEQDTPERQPNICVRRRFIDFTRLRHEALAATCINAHFLCTYCRQFQTYARFHAAQPFWIVHVATTQKRKKKILNSRRVSADKTPAKKDSEKETNIAFDDKRKLIKPETSLFIPGPQVQVIALADWESAPTFLLEEKWGKRVPVASKDSLLNKCNPFLSDNRSIKRLRLKEYDNMSEAPTMSTDCSSVPEGYVEEDTAEIEDHQEEDGVIEEQAGVIKEQPASDDLQTPLTNDINYSKPIDPATNSSKSAGVGLIRRFESCKPEQQPNANKDEPVHRSFRWVCGGHGRYVKVDLQQRPGVNAVPKAEVSWSVRWVRVGYGRYEKHFVNNGTREQALTT